MATNLLSSAGRNARYPIWFSNYFRGPVRNWVDKWTFDLPQPAMTSQGSKTTMKTKAMFALACLGLLSLSACVTTAPPPPPAPAPVVIQQPAAPAPGSVVVTPRSY
jgi:hypothetical protein